MEGVAREVPTKGSVSFKNKQKLRTCKQRIWTRGNEKLAIPNEQYHIYESMDIPVDTMKFLCRSWSPTASNLLQTFSSSNIRNEGQNQRLDVDDKYSLKSKEENADIEIDDLVEQEGTLQVEDSKKAATVSNRNNLWTRTLIERSIPAILQSCKLHYINRGIKQWLREKQLRDVMKWKKGKKKEEVRLLTAKIHAALSVTQLAAVIAGYSATNTNEDMKMRNAVAYATALLASACAEAAESAGANRADIASAVNSGLSTQRPADIITLTAAAATSLRGAETLKSRAMTKEAEAVTLSAKLSVIIPSGQKALKLVRIHLKNRQLIMILEKKFLGVLTTSREYTILQAIRGKQSQRQYLLDIKCNDGNVQLLFEDKEQSLVWMSIISRNLQICNTCHL